MERITITNPNKATFTFTLYHSVYCADGNTCKCAKETILRSGVGGSYYSEICNPIGVYLEHNETREFHPNVLKIQQVETALSKGLLKQVKVEVAKKLIKKSVEQT